MNNAIQELGEAFGEEEMAEEFGPNWRDVMAILDQFSSLTLPGLGAIWSASRPTGPVMRTALAVTSTQPETVGPTSRLFNTALDMKIEEDPIWESLNRASVLGPALYLALAVSIEGLDIDTDGYEAVRSAEEAKVGDLVTAVGGDPVTVAFVSECFEGVFGAEDIRALRTYWDRRHLAAV